MKRFEFFATVAALLGRKCGPRAFFNLKEHPDNETYPGLSILRFYGGLFFINAFALGDRIWGVRVNTEPMPNGVMLSMEGANSIDWVLDDQTKKEP